MAEPSPVPALASTADTTPYVPVSWAAVAAALVAGVFVIVLAVLGISAFASKRPLIEMWLLVFPLAGLVLSFAARRLIRNSEGTRTGERLVNAAWWTSLVVGLGYFAYLLAIDYSIQRDARAEAQRWVDNIIKGEIGRAFIRTLEPPRRQGLSADDTARLKAEFPDPYLAFDQCDLVQLAQRNKDQCTFTPGGLRDWSYRPTGIDCIVTGEFRCPEGKFPVNIALKGAEGVTGVEGGTRQWMIFPSPAGYVARDKMTLTPYGVLVAELHQAGGEFARHFIGLVEQEGGVIYPTLYHTMIAPEADQPAWETRGRATPARVAVGGGLTDVVSYYDPRQAEYFDTKFFRLPGGGEPDPTQKKTFADSWNAFGFVGAGKRIRNTVDTNDRVVLLDQAVEVTVPCEMPIKSSEAGDAVARCRLVVRSTDPGLLADLRRLRAEANPDQSTLDVPPDFGKRNFHWRVDRVETDLRPVVLNPTRSPGGEGQ